MAVKTFERPQLLHLNTEMVINEVLGHFDVDYAERFFCIFKDISKISVLQNAL